MHKHLRILASVLLLASFSFATITLTKFHYSLVNATGDTGPVTLFTPTATADYQVTLYLENTTPMPTASVQATISWTDDVATESQSVGAATATNVHGGLSFPIHALANTPVVLSATDFGGAQNYTIYVTALGIKT